jgi:hypothetical protein
MNTTAIATFSFFAECAQTRPHNKEQALRGAYLTAALACVALDSALERIVYEDHGARYRTIADGVTYGDAGDARVQNSINTVLEVIAKGVDNGSVVARQAREALSKMFENVRADIIAEHFVKKYNAGALVTVARELDDRAHAINPAKIQSLSVEAKSVLGVFADFVQAKRSVLLNGKLPEARNEVLKAASDVTSERKSASEMAAEQKPTSDALMKQERSSDATTEQSPDREGKLL